MSGSDAPREPREKPPAEPEDLTRLGARIDRLRGPKRTAEGEDAGGQGNALGYGWRISLELVVGVAFGGVVGWLLDRWLGTRPWLMIALVVLGFAAGIRNAVRTASQMEAEYLRRQGSRGSDDEPDGGRVPAPT